MSYVNMVMYGAVLPGYGSRKKDGGDNGKGVTLRADDPKNSDRILRMFGQKA